MTCQTNAALLGKSRSILRGMLTCAGSAALVAGLGAIGLSAHRAEAAPLLTSNSEVTVSALPTTDLQGPLNVLVLYSSADAGDARSAGEVGADGRLWQASQIGALDVAATVGGAARTAKTTQIWEGSFTNTTGSAVPYTFAFHIERMSLFINLPDYGGGNFDLVTSPLLARIGVTIELDGNTLYQTTATLKVGDGGSEFGVVNNNPTSAAEPFFGDFSSGTNYYYGASPYDALLPLGTIANGQTFTLKYTAMTEAITPESAISESHSLAARFGDPFFLDYDQSFTPAGDFEAVPEPASMAILALGAAGLMLVRRRTRR